ncbi:MAG: hypothetical protein JWR32_3477 [Mycobacterium sp.]|jgi:hypothetical protein|nr:hypothetical protein [Mycobacterium sp.]
MTISADDVRGLLGAGTDAVLDLVEGRTVIASPADLESPQYRGALQIVSRDELVGRVGGAELSERELVELARRPGHRGVGAWRLTTARLPGPSSGYRDVMIQPDHAPERRDTGWHE